MTPRKIKVAIAALAASLGLSMTPAIAHATPGTLVAFGDSIMANPATDQSLRSRIDPNAPRCPTDPWGLAKQAAWGMGLEPRDYSCAGGSVATVGKRLFQQVDEAIADGSLNTETRVVLINIGFNDTYGPLLSGEKEQQIRDRVIRTGVGQIERIKSVAPQAQIKIAGYTSMTEDGHTCLAQLGNNIHSRELFEFVSYIEWLADDMLRTIAQQTGSQFIDLKAASRGHSMCAPDGQRWLGGFIDLGQHRNMPVHMTPLGNEEIGRIIAQS